MEGRLQIRSFETPEGQKRRVAEVVADNVVFLDRPKGAAVTASESEAGAMEEVEEEFGAAIKMDDEDAPPF